MMSTSRTIIDMLERQRPKGAPSELTLDRFEVGDLTGPEHEVIARQIEEDPALAVHLKARQKRASGWTEADTVRLFRAVAHDRAERATRTLGDRLRAWWSDMSGFRWGMVVASGALGVALVAQSPEALNGVRTKGNQPAVSVFRERAGHVVQAESGDRFKKGDRLRFEVQLAEGRHVLLVGEEASGDLFTYYPTGTSESQFVEGGRTILPGAVRLDGSVGEEWLHILACEKEIALEEVTANGRDTLDVPEGCTQSSFAIRKETP